MKPASPVSLIVICWLGLALGGCGSLLTSDRPATTTWWLEPRPGGAAAKGAPARAVLELDMAVVPGLDTDRILTLGSDRQLNHLAGARWADHLPDVLDSVLRRSLDADGRYTVSGIERQADGTICTMRLEVQEFFGLLNLAGAVETVRIALAGQVNCGTGVRQFGVLESVAVGESSRKAVVAAFQHGLNVVTASLIGHLEAAMPGPGNS